MSRRIDRVNELLRSEISNLLAREIKDPRVVGVISITEVVASSDLRSARVYISVMGNDSDRKAAMDGIRSAASFLRRELRDRINLRHAPHMTFVLDDSIEEGDRLELDIRTQALRNATRDRTIPIEIPGMMLRLHQEGGIINFLKRNGLSALADLEEF